MRSFLLLIAFKRIGLAVLGGVVLPTDRFCQSLRALYVIFCQIRDHLLQRNQVSSLKLLALVAHRIRKIVDASDFEQLQVVRHAGLAGHARFIQGVLAWTLLCLMVFL